ncbi:Veg family protein [Faecalimicrobium sp. JNUCC 81]
MISKCELDDLKRELELKLGKTIIIRYNGYKLKGKCKGAIREYIIEYVYSNVLVLRKVINSNMGLLESYTFVDILSGVIEIIEIK